MDQERAWIEQALHGDRMAFGQLVQAYERPVYNLTYRMLGDSAEAEDAAQETFLRAYQNLHRYDASRSFGTWILSIAAHFCIDLLRKKKFTMFSMDAENDEGTTFELPDASAPDPEIESVKREQRDRLHLLLKDLDATDRATVIMRYWYDFSEVEIANSLNLTVSAVKSRLHRSRRALAGMWQEETTPSTRPERRVYESPAF
jgi:RNA polymerase sigma-70 factor (ECF subfamily)